MAQTLLFCMEAQRGLAESDPIELLREDHAFCWDVPIWTVSLNVSYWESRGTATENHSGLTHPCRVVLETVKHAKFKKKKKKAFYLKEIPSARQWAIRSLPDGICILNLHFVPQGTTLQSRRHWPWRKRKGLHDSSVPAADQSWHFF